MGQKDDEVLALRVRLRKVEDAYEQINEQASQSLNRIIVLGDVSSYMHEINREASYFKGLHVALAELARALGHDVETP